MAIEFLYSLFKTVNLWYPHLLSSVKKHSHDPWAVPFQGADTHVPGGKNWVLESIILILSKEEERKGIEMLRRKRNLDRRSWAF